MGKTDKQEADGINTDDYLEDAPEHPHIDDLSSISSEDQNILSRSGIDLAGHGRSGSFFQMDHSVVHCTTLLEGAEVLPINGALDKYDGLKEYWWKAASPDKDIYTKRAQIHQENGYFIRSLPGAKVTYPLQTCLYITTDQLAQDVHNVIISEEDSDLHVITGCATSDNVRSGLHVGVSEFYIKKSAKLTFTMIHNWPENMAVRPRTSVIMEEGATFVSNYICLMPAKDLQSYPTVIMNGEGGTAAFNSVLLSKPGSLMDVGARSIMKAKGCSTEIISRNVCTGGKIIARGHLVGEAPGVKGHLECNGLLLSEDGIIHAIPELEGKTAGVEMSHEAFVGKIAREEIEYLMSRGLNEHEATSLIIKGFISIEIEGIPPALKEELDWIVEQTGKEAL